ncbi:MAG: hypothetical protein AAGM84_07355 [Pseudomonadota bacterium]
MTRFAFGIGAAAVAVTMVANNLHAQGTTQQAGVVGASGEQTYSLQVTGADGLTYNCRPEIRDVNGTPTRFCRRVGSAGRALQFGSLNAPAVAGALAAGAIALSIVSDGSTGTTTTTTN